MSSRIQENYVGVETKTKDNVFVSLGISVQMQVVRDCAEDAIYKLTNPSSQIDSYVGNVIRNSVPQLTLEELFVKTHDIADSCQNDLAKKMEDYGYVILGVLIKHVEPDPKVKAAMNEINAARRQREAANERAEADKVLMVKKAEAEAASKELQGQGIARQRAAIIDGLRASLGGGQEVAPERVSELLLITQYFDTLDKMSQGSATTIFMPHEVGGVQSAATQMRSGILQGMSMSRGDKSR